MKNKIINLLLIISYLFFVSYDNHKGNSSEKELFTANNRLFPKLNIDTVLYSYLDSIGVSLLNCEDFIQDSFLVEIRTEYNNKMDYIIFMVGVSEGSIELQSKKYNIYGSLLINNIQYVFTYYTDSLIPPPKSINSFIELCNDSIQVTYHNYNNLSCNDMFLFRMWPVCEGCREDYHIIYSKNARSVLYTDICF